MDQNEKISTRRKFFLWGLGIASSVTALRLILPNKKKPATAKMLSEDGKLVEIDLSRVKKTGVKLSEKEIHNWIKNKPTI